MPTPGFDINEVKRRMQGATQALKHELGGLRTGRAAASMLEPVQVDAYGSRVEGRATVGAVAVQQRRCRSHLQGAGGVTVGNRPRRLDEDLVRSGRRTDVDLDPGAQPVDVRP